MELMQHLWTSNDQMSLQWLNKDIVSGPTLARIDPHIMCYINKYWNKYVMGAVFFQKYDSVEARNSESQEKDVEKCEFDKSMEQMCLRLIYLISISTLLPLEKSRHSFVV